MSTKVYGGIRFTTNDLIDLHEKFIVWRKEIQSLAEISYAKFLMNIAIAEIDEAAAKGETVDRPLFNASIKFDDRVREVKNTQRRDPAVDFDFSVSILPFEGRLYGIVFCEQQRWREAFMGLPWAEEYYYFDNTDKPEEITDEDWGERKYIWENVTNIDPYNRPCACGFTVECSPIIGIQPKIKEMLSIVPLIEDRAKAQAIKNLQKIVSEKFWEQFPENERSMVTSSQISAMYFRFKDWIKTPEGQRALNEESDRLLTVLPIITEEILIKGS